ncbi:hypothetical protein QBC46DRAFT_354 [Diplogelasinospora grovesii]|uniref:Uncharacterized protein n=1 Tax=Diplogelasinospora grovesii TaxID=303347 RepID=A0AAN6SA48_9PEZI|nr:hypothetical protein QBC46DRAFT_354 [Diplogelasinospora grovesii]
MYGSYGSTSSSSYSSYTSYTSSYSSTTRSSPMDIAPISISSHGPDASCAFPSWPRRTSLNSDESEERATSYLSDEDLFISDPFEDDARSVSSSNGSASPMHGSSHHEIQQLTEADILEMQRERAAYQREMMRFLLNEKERRRQQAKRQRRSSDSKSGSSSSKNKSPKNSKLNAMTPIAEAE